MTTATTSYERALRVQGSSPQGGGSQGRARPIVMLALVLVLVSCLALVLSSCGDGGEEKGGVPDVLVTTTYLADITQRVAGDRLTVEALFPEGSDPHGFEPTPADARRIAESRVMIVDVFGLQPAVDDLIEATMDDREATVEAAAGLPTRTQDGEDGDIDPHFWLDPLNVVGYVDNIRAALAAIDPDGSEQYAANAQSYQAELNALDEWIRDQVAQIPPEDRLLVTNHESFGYFADRYGFEVVGTVFGAGGSQAAPSAQQLAELIDTIEETGAPAIFLEAGSNEELAEQVARETGVTVVTDLYLHSLGEEAPTYVDMMRWNVTKIVEALR